MSRPSIAELDRQLRATRDRAERTMRALDALHHLSIASRGTTRLRDMFHVTEQELRGVFPFDACYIAVCDPNQPNIFRAVLLVDEGEAIYEEFSSFGSLTGRIITSREPLLFADLAAQRTQIRETPNTFGNAQRLSRAWVGVPLLVGSDSIGVISLQSYEPNIYTNDDVELLQQLGDVVAVVLENVLLDEQQQSLSAALASQVSSRTSELATLSQLAGDLVMQLPLTQLMDQALDQVLPLFGMDAATVRLLDSRGDQLGILAQRGFSEAYARAAAVIPIEGTATGSIIQTNQPITIERGIRESALDYLLDYLPYESLLGIPLRIGNRVIGALSIFGAEPREFNQQSISLAQAVGNQIAIAIENARLFHAQERQISELQALESLSRAASSTTDMSSLLRLVHDELRRFMQIDAFLMVVYDRQRGIVTDALAIDDGTEYVTWRNEPPPPSSMTAWVLSNSRLLHIRDFEREAPRFITVRRNPIGSRKGAVSWLGTPLLNAQQEPIGAFSVQSYRAYAFTERDEEFVKNVAGQLALHLQNLQLLAQRERQIQQLDATGRIGQMVSALYNLDDILSEVYQAISQIEHPSVFYLLLFEPDTRSVSHAIFIEEGRPVTLNWIGQPPPSGSITEWIINQREPLLLHDLVNQKAELHTRGIQPRSVGPDNPVRSWIGVPLLSSDSLPIGVLSLQDYQPYAYDDQTIDFLSQVASHISLGVQKVRLFHERERQLAENARLYAAEQEARRTADTLREIARVLSTSFDPREVLDLILRELNTVIDYNTASIMLVDNDLLQVAAARNFDETRMTREFRLRSQHSAAASVVYARAPIYLPDVSLAPDWEVTAVGQLIRSWIGVPLMVKNRVIGVLNIDAHEPDFFNQRDIEVAEAFAIHAAVALENARLYAESITRVEQELTIARRIQENLFPNRLPQIEGLEIAARCLPARETGGDFFDFIQFEEADSLGLFVGDASGKSIPGAMLMAIAHSIARSEARDHRLPELVMRETNAWITKDVPPNSFVALCYATLDLGKQQLALANAGQLTPIRRRADGVLDYLEAPGPRLPLGILPNIAYATAEFTVRRGDLLLLFTDGIVEAKNNRHELFGFERLEALLRIYGELPVNELLDVILSATNEFTAGTPPHDDMTLVALRIR